jgi:FKBP-type peptidyl-prolyl cis-trans isomerase SlpA
MRVQADSYLTLHYCLSTPEGETLVSTFDLSPATLQMGSGQLAPQLEARLIGLQEGAHQVFDLSPEEAFGAANPHLVERIARTALPPEAVSRENALVEFSTPEGKPFSGFLRALSDTHATFDFNHPLAGKRIRFEVKIIAVL